MLQKGAFFNLKKQLPNSKSKPFNTPIDRVSFKTTHLDASGPNLSKNVFLGQI